MTLPFRLWLEVSTTTSQRCRPYHRIFADVPHS
jgi:hypothetical protein